MLEPSENLNGEQVLRECERRGLVVRSEREPGAAAEAVTGTCTSHGRPGTLEMNECCGGVSLKVHPKRDGGWASTLAAELRALSDGGGVDPGARPSQ